MSREQVFCKESSGPAEEALSCDKTNRPAEEALSCNKTNRPAEEALSCNKTNRPAEEALSCDKTNRQAEEALSCDKTNRPAEEASTFSDVVWDKDLRTVPWVCDGLNIPPDSLRVFLALAFIRNGKLSGALLFHDGYAAHDVWWTLYTVRPDWCCRRFLRKAFRTAFCDLKCDRIGLLVKETNHRSLSLVRRLGFVEEGCLRQLGENKENCYAFSMLKNECSWLTA